MRDQLFEEMKSKLHPNVKAALEKDGVLADVCYALADDEIFWKQLAPKTVSSGIIRIYDYWTDMYTHVTFKGKKYRFDDK